MKHLRKALPVFGLMTTVLTLFFLTALPVHAAGALTLSTMFPGITVTAGKTVNFSLTLTNTGSQPLNTEISVSDLPAGWSAHFTGGGNQVSRVFVLAESYSAVTLSIEIPAGTKEGTYPINVTAAADGVSDTLALSLSVSAEDVSQGQFTSQFPELQGGTSTNFTFSTNLVNSSSEDSYFSLTSAAPTGWQVAFRPTAASSDVASLTVPAGQTQAITITVRPPSDVKAGEYMIPVTAVSATASLALNLKVTITGSYSMALTTKDGRLNAEVQIGRESPITLIIINNGSADLTNIALTSTLPNNGWAIRFDQATIESIPAGGYQEVLAFIQPDSRAVTGDYAAAISASTAAASSTVELRIAVQTSTLWGIVAVVIIVLLAFGLYLVFRKFGRR